jgi:hypothetical protein
MKTTKRSTNGRTNGFHFPMMGVKTLVEQLKKLWVPYTHKGLEVRLEMGAKLNDKLASPMVRQPHGAEVLKHVANELRIHESELSRMRWFAYLFGSVKVLNRQYPDDRSWAQVKERLPELIAKVKGQVPPTSRPARKTAILCGIQKSLDSITSKLRRKELQLDEAERKMLVSKLKKLVKAAESRLALHVSITTK